MQPNKRIYLSPPHMSGRELELINEVFESNWIAPLGPQVDCFETELSGYLGVEGTVVLSSGTAAIHLALQLLDVGQDDRVFCSALTFAASAYPIIYQGAIPVFIDSEPESWNMSPETLEQALKESEGTGLLPKTVIVVNLYGQSADMDRIIKICSEYEIPVIEDAAESLGATYKGEKSGSLGHFGILSFNGNKIITTSGGGALVSNDTEALDRARYLATQARQPVRHYEHTEVGYNYRMSNVLAAIGRAQLEVIEDRVKTKRFIFKRYHDALSEIDGIEFMPEAQYGRSTQWLTVITVDPERCGVNRDELIDSLESVNIEARPVWKPMQMQPLFKDNSYYEYMSGQSISERLFNIGLCLPSGTNMSGHEQLQAIEIITTRLFGRL